MGIRSMWPRRVVSVAGLVALLLLLPVAGAPAQLSPGPLQRYAEGTWASFAAMTDEQSGLPADTLKADGTGGQVVPVGVTSAESGTSFGTPFARAGS